MGRPPKGDRTKTEQVLVKLTRHQLRVLDAIVDLDRVTTVPDQTRQDFLRDLIRVEYTKRLKAGMPKVTGE